jgi:hypothetical protein
MHFQLFPEPQEELVTRVHLRIAGECVNETFHDQLASRTKRPHHPVSIGYLRSDRTQGPKYVLKSGSLFGLRHLTAYGFRNPAFCFADFPNDAKSC